MESQGSRSMIYFARLLRSRAWSELVPDYAHTVLVSGYGDINSSDYAAAARTKSGSTVLIYTPTQRVLTVAMDQLTGASARGWWYDPSTGVPTLIGDLPAQGERQFTPPSQQDWVLVLDNAAADLSPPGEIVPVETLRWGRMKLGFGRK